MPAPEGNSNALKFGTPELRQKLCADYIAHIESALSDECFPDCDPATLKKYIAEFPIDFDTDKIQVAKRKRQLFWEKAGRDGTMGQIEGFNASSWKFNMGNRFGWAEKREDKVTVKKDSAADLAQRVFDDKDEEEDTSVNDFDSPGPTASASEGDLASEKAEGVQEDQQDAQPVPQVV